MNMEEKDSRKLELLFEEFLDVELFQIVFSNSADKEKMLKAKARPFLLNGRLVFQIEKFVGKQAFHQNLSREEAVSCFTELLKLQFRQCELQSERGWAQVLISKKGTVTVKKKMAAGRKAEISPKPERPQKAAKEKDNSEIKGRLDAKDDSSKEKRTVRKSAFHGGDSFRTEGSLDAEGSSDRNGNLYAGVGSEAGFSPDGKIRVISRRGTGSGDCASRDERVDRKSCTGRDDRVDRIDRRDCTGRDDRVDRKGYTGRVDRIDRRDCAGRVGCIDSMGYIDRASLLRLAHNRTKAYVLEEGIPVPFLVDLGVMTREGKVVRSKYDKFRQINRFLEFVEDILPQLSKDRENTIIDFGCGKSYLTFAMYHYLKEMKGYDIRVIGLDLKQDVIDHCNALSRKYGFETLQFYHGDIASYEGVDHVDMVVTLHACDTATDFALAKAVKWGAQVILSVPCCQHEWNGQMKNELMKPILQYGLLKERIAALYTDGLRAEILEHMGYRTQILEFIDMEHTPKNILIRAVYQGKPKNNQKEIQEILDFWNVKPTLASLLLRRPESES